MDVVRLLENQILALVIAQVFKPLPLLKVIVAALSSNYHFDVFCHIEILVLVRG